MNRGVEDLSIIAAAIAELTDNLTWLETWLASKALLHNCPGIIARELRRSRWYVKKLNVVAERFPYLLPTDKEAADTLMALSTVELYDPDREHVPNPEIPVDIYRLAAHESEGPVGANAWIRLVREQSLSLRQLQKVIRRMKGEDVAIPYMQGAKMRAQVEGGSITLTPVDGEAWEPHGDTPEMLVVTAIEVEYHKEDSEDAESD